MPVGPVVSGMSYSRHFLVRDNHAFELLDKIRCKGAISEWSQDKYLIAPGNDIARSASHRGRHTEYRRIVVEGTGHIMYFEKAAELCRLDQPKSILDPRPPATDDVGTSAAHHEIDAPADASGADRVVRRLALRWPFPTNPITGLLLFLRLNNLDEPIFAAIAGHWGLLRILRHPKLRAFMSQHPQLAYRPFRTYLARSFGKKQRRQILAAHYLYLSDRLSESFFSLTARRKIRLWQLCVDQQTYSITVSFSGQTHCEGDLLLEFQLDGLPLYHLGFAIAPGHVLGSTAKHMILIARLQGVREQFALIRHATKACLDNAPSHVLISALQGIAGALRIERMAGVSNSEQLKANDPKISQLYFDYDKFWRSILACETGRFFQMSVPLDERPLGDIAIAHRRRTRLKRRFKAEVREAVRSAFVATCVDRSSR